MIITNLTLHKIADELEVRNGYLSAISELVGTGKQYLISDWTPVKAMIANGSAHIKFPIGTQFLAKYTDSTGKAWDMPFDVVHYGKAITESGEEKDAMYLQSHYATIESVQFDAPEPSNADVNIQKYGYNRWSQSACRQWLNSSALKNEWWTAQSDTDVAPTQHGQYNGFLHGLDDTFKEAITPVKIKTACNTVTDGGVIDETVDKIFLPSIEQMYGVPELLDAEGEYWHYWRYATLFDAPSNNADAGRIVYSLDNKQSAQFCRLRSAHRGYSSSAWYVHPTGILYYDNANNAFRYAPACVIC